MNSADEVFRALGQEAERAREESMEIALVKYMTELWKVSSREYDNLTAWNAAGFMPLDLFAVVATRADVLFNLFATQATYSHSKILKSYRRLAEDSESDVAVVFNFPRVKYGVVLHPLDPILERSTLLIGSGQHTFSRPLVLEPLTEFVKRFLAE